MHVYSCTVVNRHSDICVVTAWKHFKPTGKPSVISFWKYALTHSSLVHQWYTTTSQRNSEWTHEFVLLTSEWVYLKGDWTVSVVGFWMYSLVLTCVVWAVRMSILFSIARIVHPTERMRRIVTALVVFFSLICLTFIATKLWWYTHDLSWLKKPAFYTLPVRWLPYSMYIYELCVDCISDTILIS
ncbi:hypothetical protein OG21DRAFT_509571 [Imleria badia]|nr:hypothetical protein OG21DRAFT_509571 [Imleria badia]